MTARKNSMQSQFKETLDEGVFCGEPNEMGKRFGNFVRALNAQEQAA